MNDWMGETKAPFQRQHKTCVKSSPFPLSVLVVGALGRTDWELEGGRAGWLGKLGAGSLAFKKNIANSCPDKNVSLRPKEVVTASERASERGEGGA